MGKRVDLTGKKFGSLVVVKQVEKPAHLKTLGVYWLCTCSCGRDFCFGEVAVLANSLRRGATTGCGCNSKPIELTGKISGRLTVLHRAKTINGRTRWTCKCSCGKVKDFNQTHLVQKTVLSCGCLKAEVTVERNYKHGLSVRGKVSPIYKRYASMKDRCLNPNSSCYHRYGGRGISVCAEWLNADTGLKSFANWLLAAGFKGVNETREIDRIDNDGDYSPNNCRLVSHKENCSNQSDRAVGITGYRGVYRHISTVGLISYVAKLKTVDGKRVYARNPDTGTILFDTAEAANRARLKHCFLI